MRNATADVRLAVLVDGHRVADSSPGGADRDLRSATQRSLLATLPETTFFRRYREVLHGLRGQ